MSAFGKVEAHEGVARLEAGHDDCHVRLCTGVRLDVGIFSVIELLHTLDGKRLDLVYDLATAIVALSGVTFSVFVGADGSHCLHDLVGDVVLGSDKLQTFGLSLALFLNQSEYLSISFHDFVIKVSVLVNAFYKYKTFNL